MPAGGREIELQVALAADEARAVAQVDDLRSWLEMIVEGIAPSADSWTVRLVDDDEMRGLNHRFRQLDKTTDVLSFTGDLSDHGMPEQADHAGWPAIPESAELPRHLGDVVISLPTARRQAEAGGHDLDHEIKTLALHGLLHCLGFDHETDDGTMERQERRLRQRYLTASPRRASA